MSLEFNRRSFLKYSAAAAVAVAGSSLLVGCGEDEYQKTGKIGSTLKLMGTFRMYDSPDAPVYTVTIPATATAPATGYFVRAISEHQVHYGQGSSLRELRANFELTVNSTGKSKDDVDYLDQCHHCQASPGAGSSGGKYRFDD